MSGNEITRRSGWLRLLRGVEEMTRMDVDGWRAERAFVEVEGEGEDAKGWTFPGAVDILLKIARVVAEVISI